MNIIYLTLYLPLPLSCSLIYYFICFYHCHKYMYYFHFLSDIELFHSFLLIFISGVETANHTGHCLINLVNAYTIVSSVETVNHMSIV